MPERASSSKQLCITIDLAEVGQLPLAIQHRCPPAYIPRVPHRAKPGISLDPVQGIQILTAFSRKVFHVRPVQRRILVPIRRRELGDPYRLVGPQLVMRGPYVVVELVILSGCYHRHVLSNKPYYVCNGILLPDPMSRRTSAAHKNRCRPLGHGSRRETPSARSRPAEQRISPDSRTGCPRGGGVRCNGATLPPRARPACWIGPGAQAR